VAAEARRWRRESVVGGGGGDEYEFLCFEDEVLAEENVFT